LAGQFAQRDLNLALKIMDVNITQHNTTQHNTITDITLIYASETLTLTKRERKKLNIFERKMYRRVLGPVYGNEKEHWRILTNK
jgi:hypothetical protein